MKKTLIAFVALGALGGAHAEVGLKAGLWETRTTKMVVDGNDMMPKMKAAADERRQAMAKIPAEQRQKIEAATGQSSTDPMARRTCISAAMAANPQPMLPRPARAECEPPKLKRNGNRTEFELKCKQAGGTLTGKGETVLTENLLVSRINTHSTDAAGAKHTMVAETQMKYLGQNCGALKPIDELLKGTGAASAAPPAAAPPQSAASQ